MDRQVSEDQVREERFAERPAALPQPPPAGECRDVCTLALADVSNHGERYTDFKSVYKALLCAAFYLKATECENRKLLGFEIRAEVSRDLEARIEMGAKKYGTRLKTHNGRNARIDLQKEIYDAIMYARQEIQERSE